MPNWIGLHSISAIINLEFFDESHQPARLSGANIFLLEYKYQTIPSIGCDSKNTPILVVLNFNQFVSILEHETIVLVALFGHAIGFQCQSHCCKGCIQRNGCWHHNCETNNNTSNNNRSNNKIDYNWADKSNHRTDNRTNKSACGNHHSSSLGIRLSDLLAWLDPNLSKSIYLFPIVCFLK